MATLGQLQRRVSEVNALDIFIDVLKQFAPEMVDANTGQLEEGIDANGQNIGVYQSFTYASFKNKMNKKPGFGNVDLILTGDFTDGFVTRVTRAFVEFTSTDSKTSDLTSRYGKNIFGLTRENQEEIITLILPEFRERVRAILKI